MEVNANHPDVRKARAAGISPLIHVVACGKSKQAAAAPAASLYTGDLTRKHVEWVGTRVGEFGGEAPALIASAKHGLVELDTVLDPYDEALTRFTPEQVDAWVAMVEGQLAERGLTGARLAVYGGATYKRALGRVARAHFATPPVGVGDRKRGLRKLLDYTYRWEAA